jgi:antitoxin MazE
MKKDLNKNDEYVSSTKNISKPSLPKNNIRSWLEWGSKEIAKHGDDYLILGEFPNLEDKYMEW